MRKPRSPQPATVSEYIAQRLSADQIVQQDEIQLAEIAEIAEIQRQLREAVAEAAASPKFKKWTPNKPAKPQSSRTRNKNIPPEYPHYTCAALAKVWGLSTDTIRSLFENEPGVLKIGNPNPKYKRRYVTLRIPSDVAERVHRRRS